MYKRYIVTIHYKGLFSRNYVFNMIDKGKVEDGKFYAYEDNCFKLYYSLNGKEHISIFPLDKIDHIDIKEVN